MRTRHGLTRLAVVALIGATAACARAVEVSSGPSPTYPIQVRNTVSVDVIVSYDDGAGARILGTVPAGRTERFIIAAPRTTTVTITGRNAAGSRSWGPYTVSLEAGVAQTVTLR